MEKLNAQQTRGERKLKILEKAEFDKDKKALDWIKTQPTWTEDIKLYKDSLKPVEEVKETKSKGKK